MKIGQISFLQMTTPADHPYGAGQLGSKYQGQEGPTAEPVLEELRDAERVALSRPASAVGEVAFGQRRIGRADVAGRT